MPIIAKLWGIVLALGIAYMDYELNDHDRADMVKRFFARYGYFILVGIILFAIALGINKFWQNHQLSKDTAASNAYQGLLNSIKNGAKPEVIQAGANQLIQDYPGTPYAALAELNLAQIAVSQNDLATAEKNLQMALNANSHNGLTPIISLRLARVLLAENKAQAVVDLLQDPPQAYEVPYGLLLGDAYVQLKNNAAAKATYQAALKAANSDPALIPLLNARVNNLS